MQVWEECVHVLVFVRDWKIPRKVITESYEQKTGGSPKRKKGDSNLEDEKLVKIKKPKDSIASPQPQQFTYEDKADGAKLVIDVLMPYLRNKVIENENEFKWLAKKLTHKALKKGFARGKHNSVNTLRDRSDMVND